MERISRKDLPEGLMRVMLQVENYLHSTDLEPSLYKLIKLRASQINGCGYCIDMHTKEGLEAGETVQRMMGLRAWQEAPFYTSKEKAVLSFTERLTGISQEKSIDDLHEQLQEFFTPRQIANLSLAVAQINSWNRIVISFGTTPGAYQLQKTGHSKEVTEKVN